MGQGRPSKIALSHVRIRRKLPLDGVKKTIGGGCIVKWTLGSSTKSRVFLFTTTQVITKNDLIASNGSISVELLDGEKILSFSLGDKCGTDLPEPIPGRVLGGTGEALKEVSFIMIPVENFDDRNWLWSKLQGNIFEKRSLTCSFPSDKTLQSYILKKEIFCFVICDVKSRNDSRFETETYCLEFGQANSEEFVLSSPLDQGCTDEIRRLKKDFYREEKPKGALLISKDCEFLGLLGIALKSNKIFPLFLPTLDLDNKTTVKKEVCNIAGPVTKTSIEATGGSLQAMPDEKSSQEERNKMMLNNQDVPPEGEILGNGSTSEVQRSGNPASNSEELGNSSSGLDLVQADLENDSILRIKAYVRLQPEVDPSEDGHDHYDMELDCPPSRPPENVDPALPEDDPPSLLHHEPVQVGSDSNSLDDDVDEQEQPPSESSGSPKPIPETEPPKQIFEVSSVIRGSNGSGDDLESGIELEGVRGFKGHDLPRSLSEADNPSYFHGAQGSIGPLTRQNTTPGDLERVFSGSLVKDKIVNRAKVMEVVSLHLDRSNCPGKREECLTPGWEQLADAYKLPEKIKSRCQNFMKGNLSPSNAMFVHLEATSNSLNIGITKTHLKKLGRKDIIDDINEVMDKNSDLSDDTTLTDLWNMHPEALWTVCLRLDDQRTLKNWWDLGSEMGLSTRILRKFKDPSGYSPSQTILEKIKTLHPTLPITRIQAVLRALNLDTVERKLDPLRDGDIQTLLGEIDVLEDVTDILDLDERHWRRFALKIHKFSVSFLDNLRPDPISSPTKMVMNCIVETNPELSMGSFLVTLKNMGRNDLILELKRIFRPQDIDVLTISISPQ